MAVAEVHRSERIQVQWASGLNILAGLWLIVAPFVFRYGVAAAIWNDVVVGAVIAVLAIMRATSPERWQSLSWTNTILGVWLIIAPFVLGYSATTMAMRNDIFLGIIVVALSLWSGYETTRMQHVEPPPPMA